MEIVSGTKIGLDVAEYVAIFCRLIVLGNGLTILFPSSSFVTLEFLSYTWIEKESGFQSCEWVLGCPIGVGNDYRYVFVDDYCYVFGNDYCYVVGKDWCCVVWDDGADCLIV